MIKTDLYYKDAERDLTGLQTWTYATGDNLTLQGKYELNATLTTQKDGLEAKKISETQRFDTIITTLKTNKVNAESELTTATQNYDTFNAMTPCYGCFGQKKDKEDGKKKWGDEISRLNGVISNLAGKIGIAEVDKKKALDQIDSDLDLVISKQKELVKSIEKELSTARAKGDPTVATLTAPSTLSKNPTAGETNNKNLIKSSGSKSKKGLYIGLGFLVLVSVSGYFIFFRKK